MESLTGELAVVSDVRRLNFRELSYDTHWLDCDT